MPIIEGKLPSTCRYAPGWPVTPFMSCLAMRAFTCMQRSALHKPALVNNNANSWYVLVEPNLSDGVTPCRTFCQVVVDELLAQFPEECAQLDRPLLSAVQSFLDTNLDFARHDPSLLLLYTTPNITFCPTVRHNPSICRDRQPLVRFGLPHTIWLGARQYLLRLLTFAAKHKFECSKHNVNCCYTAQCRAGGLSTLVLSILSYIMQPNASFLWS